MYMKSTKAQKLKSISFIVVYINLKTIDRKIFLWYFRLFLVKYQGLMIKHRYRKLNYK